MKLNKKWWLIIGFSAVALISIALVIILVVLSNQDSPKPVYSIEITVTNPELGTVSGMSDYGTYTEGDNITLTFTPNQTKCIESIYVDDVNVFDYIVDESINVENAFSYTFENISTNHKIIVKFDETLNIDGLTFKTRQESGVADMDYGYLEIWGASKVFPRSGRVKLHVVSDIHYDFYAYVLPDERDAEKSCAEDYEYTNSVLSASMIYDSESQTFTMSSAFIKLAPINGQELELVFVPVSIELVVYFSNDGETFAHGLTEQEKLYNDYKIDVSYANNYTWYYCLYSDVIASNLRTNQMEMIEKDVQGVTSKYIKLHHNLYADGIDSKKIILVCVLND